MKQPSQRLNLIQIISIAVLALAGTIPAHADDSPSPEAPKSASTYLSKTGQMPPLPYHPFPDVPTLQVGDRQFVYDDSAVDYPVLRELSAALSQALNGPVPAVAEGGSPMSLGTDACALLLEILAGAPGELTVTLQNTVPGQRYELLSKQDLNATAWTPEQTLFGTSGQDWTQTTVAIMGQPALFLMAVQSGFVTEKEFEGIGYAEAGTVNPDSMGAVGPDHLVEIINRHIVIFDKHSGNRIPDQTQPLSQFLGEANMFDPRILYDHEAQA